MEKDKKERLSERPPQPVETPEPPQVKNPAEPFRQEKKAAKKRKW